MVAVPLTSAERDVSELLPCSQVVVEVALGFEVHPLHPGVLQTVVNGRGDADLVADGDGVSCSGLREHGTLVLALTFLKLDLK